MALVIIDMNVYSTVLAWDDTDKTSTVIPMTKISHLFVPVVS